jgi:hypothetical protein
LTTIVSPTLTIPNSCTIYDNARPLDFCSGSCGGSSSKGIGLMDYSLDNILLFRVKICGERFIELGLFLLEF